MNTLQKDIRSIRGIGEKRAQALGKLGVFSLFDLISYFPKRYEDRSQIKPIALVQDGESVCICAVCGDEPRLSRIRRGLDIVRFRAFDSSAQVSISYFNQSYVRNQIHRGESYRFYGKMEVRGSQRSLTNPVFEPEESPLSATGAIVPVYRVCAGLPQRSLRQSIQAGLDQCLDEIPELLPEPIRREHALIGVREAYRAIHFPEDYSVLEQARRRFVFEELFLLSCALGMRRQERSAGIPLPVPDFEEFYARLPFRPTQAQRRAVSEAAADLASGNQMTRLLQGDVGSGKTLAAAALIWQCARAGRLSLLMAPTQILAQQHCQTLSGFLEPMGLRIALLTGAVRAAERKSLQEKLDAGELDLIIGTHALLSEGLRFPRLALTVTDEQHRFGVEQRAKLTGQPEQEDGSSVLPDSRNRPLVRPHVYVMSATPIPRTLALIIYGELDVSLLDELPPGRRAVETFCVDSRYRARLLAFIRKLCGEGRQVFVVCPKVEEDTEETWEASPAPSEQIPRRGKLESAVEEAERLKKELPGLRVSCIHGRMKSAEKDAVMRAVLEGAVDVLVSTTVIEVGVDVPNAALMLIENAERFGLSQLHQLRGRVGRGVHQSYCVLVTDSETKEAKARMQVMCESNDGFRIAEEDLRLRGPGDFFGSRQHGLPETHVADLGTDTETLMRSKEAAERLLREDPELQLPEHRALRERVEMMAEKMNGTLN
ncbi:MAG: ATP-dependent DNA helicase RecG [Oscillospiraceae bacterium]|nr:ATP-dependent DNA helicase RecG [Oscillospiraceae bacterium]